MSTEEFNLKMKLTAREKKLLELIRSTGYGEMLLIIQKNQPVKVEEITNIIKL